MRKRYCEEKLFLVPDIFIGWVHLRAPFNLTRRMFTSEIRFIDKQRICLRNLDQHFWSWKHRRGGMSKRVLGLEANERVLLFVFNWTDCRRNWSIYSFYFSLYLAPREIGWNRISLIIYLWSRYKKASSICDLNFFKNHRIFPQSMLCLWT